MAVQPRASARLLPPGADRHLRHQLVFELVPIAALLVLTVTADGGMWRLVVVAAALLLPATRAIWVWWLRRGVGLALGVAAAVACTGGIDAVVGVWTIGCAIGIARLLLAGGAADQGRGQALVVSRR